MMGHFLDGYLNSGSHIEIWIILYLLSYDLRSNYDKRPKTMNALHSPQNDMTAGARTAIRSSVELLIASSIH